MTVSPIDANNGEPWKVKFYHFEGWPDGAVPEGVSLDELKILIDKAAHHIIDYKGHPKTLVHCHAGLGRTGTTLSFI